MSEDLSEGEKGDLVGEMVSTETPRKKFQRNLSNLEVWSDDKKEKKLYIVLIRYVLIMHMPYSSAATALLYIFSIEPEGN